MTTSVALGAAIMQGDAYPIPVYVKIDGSVATPENIDALRVRIGNMTDEYPNGTITEQRGVWLFPMTQAQSYGLMAGEVPVQAQVMRNGCVIGTAVTTVNVGKSILKGVWGDGT